MSTEIVKKAPIVFVPISEVQRRVGLSRSAIHRQMAAGTFPRSVTCGLKAARWRESEIEDWQRARLAERVQPSPQRSIAA